MKQRTKENLGNIFGGLFSNQRAINGAKHNPWWVAIIMFILAVVVAVLPITVNTFSAYGSSFLAGRVNSWDTQITTASLDLYNDGYDFLVGSNHEIQLTKNNVAQTNYTDDTKPLFEYIDDSRKDESNNVISEITFQLYYTDQKVSSPDKNTPTVNDIFKAITNKKWEVGTTNEYVEPTEPSSESSEAAKVYYRPSFMLIFPEGYYAYLAVPRSLEAIGSTGGDWLGFEEGTLLLKRVLTAEGFNPATDTASNPDYTEAVFNNWKKIYDIGFLNTKNTSTLTSSLIFLGVYAGLSFFMGLMIFLLTRGKKNPFNYLSFWTCFKINAWASVSPGLLSLILGFMIPSYTMMFFIILHGVRTMWMTTKQFKPQY
jgi:hypothetical protein